MAGLTDLTDATPAGEIDPEASKSAAERAAEAERLEAARAAALERASQAEEEAAAAVRDRDDAGYGEQKVCLRGEGCSQGGAHLGLQKVRRDGYPDS